MGKFEKAKENHLKAAQEVSAHQHRRVILGLSRDTSVACKYDGKTSLLLSSEEERRRKVSRDDVVIVMGCEREGGKTCLETLS